MPNDLIERMARANDPVGWAWYDSTSEVQSDMTQQTRIMFEKAQLTCMRRALTAIREPTERMVAAANEQCGPIWDHSSAPPVLTPRFAVTDGDRWRAMIDAELGVKPSAVER